MNKLLAMRIFIVFLLSILSCVCISAPGDILFEEFFNNNGDFTSDWTTTASGAGTAAVTSDTFNSASNALALSGDPVTVTSDPINANVPGVVLTAWVRRGDDSFSENPDSGEDLTLQYLNNLSVWTTLETWAGNGTSGEIITPSYTLPADALYANLQIRFVLADGSGSSIFDFWHIDDVVLTETGETFDIGACISIFSNGIQSNSDAGSITLNQNVTVTAGTETLDTSSLSIPGSGVTCNGSTCVSSGSSADDVTVTFPSFPATDGGVTVNAGNTPLSIGAGDYDAISITTNGGELEFSAGGTTTTLTSLTASNNNSIIEFSPGDYYIQNDFVLSGSQIELRLSTAGTVRLFVGGSVTLGSNIDTTDFVDNSLLIYASGSMSLSNSAVVYGYLFSEGTVTMNNNAVVNGAVSGASVVMQNNSTVNYATSASVSSEIEEFCTINVDVPTPIAEYHLDEDTYTGAADEVLDTSGNDLHGAAIDLNGLITTNDADPAISGDPGTCNYGEFDGTSDGYIEIADPGLGSILDTADNFTVAVWVYPTSWPGSGLATIVSKDENYEFHLNSSGNVNWWWGGGARQLNSSSSVPLNEWHHIAITYQSGEQIIYIDGVEDAQTNVSGSATLNNDNLFIGTDLNFHSRRFNGEIDEVKIYDATLSPTQINAVMLETQPCTSGGALINNFLIDVGGGAASTCVPQQVTITARDSLNNTITGYVGSINLTTSTGNGDWTNTTNPLDAQGSLSAGANDSGAATYQFELAAADNGSVVLNLGNQHAETLTITVEDTSAGVNTTSSSLTFSENAFVVSITDSLSSDVVAGRDHNFRVEMYQRDSSTGICSVATNYNQANVKAWVTRDVTDPSGAAPSIENNAGTDTEILPDSEPASADLTLSFSSGVADFDLLTSDVGRYAINFLDDGNGFSDQDISGSSSTFVVRPFGFYLQVTGNPGAVDESGGAFIAAGTDFTASTQAVAWQSDDDTDDDGVPDGHDDSDPSTWADLSNNVSVASFGLEAENIVLAATLVAPTPGTAAGLATSEVSPADGRIIDSFISGAGSTSTIYYPEVGIIELSADVEDGDYLNAGATITDRMSSRSSYIGRFIPANFTITPLGLNDSCGFMYMSENYNADYTVQANNSLGSVATNYRNNFIMLDATSGSVSIGAIDAVVPTPLTSRISVSGTTFTWNDDGTGNLQTSFALDRAASPDGPYSQFDVGVTVSDEDSVSVLSSILDLDSDNDTSNDLVNIGRSDVRFGRLILSDAFGPETANLPVDFLLQYWNGSSWQVNVDDDCTAIAQTDINYVGQGTIDVLANRTLTIGGGSTTGSYGDDSASAINFSAGDADHFFTAPGTGNTGSVSVDVDLSSYPWLRFDWNGDGSFTDAALPTATFSFGQYRNHDRVIFWQEVLN